ncbi:hypothetical protein NC653_032048 [Populus alba x Populus x berolinensis]|uniref:Uncharacterized protein n=1 Tax=Populus alba x Populus x berolinensis TaxID=444605 RepID=A0AAD6PYM3_9ROSI|nr:hypothetical protein NC653_032048 [Populus alba x Populus x berolinensis]
MLVGFGLGDDCFCSWAIVFFCLGLLPIALDSSTHFASAFDSASLRLVSRPALPSQLKPPMGVRFASTLIDENLEVWLRLVGVVEIWLMGGVIETRLWLGEGPKPLAKKRSKIPKEYTSDSTPSIPVELPSQERARDCKNTS